VVFNELPLEAAKDRHTSAMRIRDGRTGRIGIEGIVAPGAGPRGRRNDTSRERWRSRRLALRETDAQGTVRSGGMNTPRGNEGVGEHVRTRFHAGPFGPVEIAGS